MASGLSITKIFNMALDLLEEETVTDPTDDRPAANWLNRNYDITRDAVLRAHPWNFALERVSLAESATTPAFGWDHRYEVPADWVRVLPLTVNGELDAKRIPYRKEAAFILTNADPPLKAMGVRRVTDPQGFDILFAEALAARLAMKMANWMTGKQSYAQRMAQIYEDIVDQARLVDSLEAGTPDYPIDDLLEESRHSF